MTGKPLLKDRLIDALRNTLDALSQVRDCHDCIRIWEREESASWEQGLWDECEALIAELEAL